MSDKMITESEACEGCPEESAGRVSRRRLLGGGLLGGVGLFLSRLLPLKGEVKMKMRILLGCLVGFFLLAIGGAGFSFAPDGESQTAEFPFRYVPVREAPPGIVEGLTSAARRWQDEVRSGERRGLGQPLSEVKDEAGSLLMPTYLPQGLSYDQAFVSQPHPPNDRRFKGEPPQELIFSKQGERGTHFVSIISSSPPPSPLPVKVKEGSFKPVSVDGNPGYVIRGGWGARVDASSGSVDVGWMEDAGLALVFIRDGELARVKGTPASAFTEEELIKVAESLELY